MGRFRGGLGRLLVVAVAAIGTGCVSGGGVQRAVMTQAEIDLLLAEYVGIWALDESASSPQVTIPRPETRTETRVVRADQLDDLRREAEEGRRLMAVRQATFELLLHRPESLALGMEGEGLVSISTPGESITLPVNGGWVSRGGGVHRVRTRAFWDGPCTGSDGPIVSSSTIMVASSTEGSIEGRWLAPVLSRRQLQIHAVGRPEVRVDDAHEIRSRSGGLARPTAETDPRATAVDLVEAHFDPIEALVPTGLNAVEPQIHTFEDRFDRVPQLGYGCSPLLLPVALGRQWRCLLALRCER